MGTLFSSNFPGTNDTNLQSNGEGFVRHPTTSSYTNTYSNSARQPATLASGASSIYTRPGIAGLELAHEVSVDLDTKTLLTNTNSIGVLIACDATLFTTYIGYYQPNIGKLRIAKRINGTETVLREMDFAITAGTIPRMRFRREWDDTLKNTLSLFMDGVSMFTPAVDTSITVIGSPGIRRYDSTGSSDTTGIHYKNFSVDTLDSGSTEHLITASPSTQANLASSIAAGQGVSPSLITISPSTRGLISSAIAVTSSLPGTLVIPAVRDWETNNLKLGVTGVTVDVLDIATGELVKRFTGQTTHATTGNITLTDPLILAATTYGCVTRFVDGKKGFWDYTSS